MEHVYFCLYIFLYIRKIKNCAEKECGNLLIFKALIANNFNIDKEGLFLQCVTIVCCLYIFSSEHFLLLLFDFDLCVAKLQAFNYFI